jgi:GntR family transcriptional regulator/MocR family aminotransferase
VPTSTPAPRVAADAIAELHERAAAPGTTRHARLCAAIRDAIARGRWQAGAALPPTRALAASLGVSRSTVVAAYEQLIADGVLEARVGSGTVVRADATAGIGDARAASAHAASAGATAAGTRFASLVEASAPLAAALKARATDPPVAFRLASPDLSRFPWSTWRRLYRDALRTLPAWKFGEGDPRGDPGLRDALARYLRGARGIDCEPDDLLITAGSQQAIDLVARALLVPGDAVWFEEPGYTGAWLALAAHRPTLHPLAIDAEGARVDAAIDTLPAPKLVYLTPSNQFPLGSVLSWPRRAALLRHIEAVDGWIVEDDYDGEFRAPGLQVPPLRAADGGRRVFHVGTFSKTLYLGLRIGWLVVPRVLRDVFATLRLAQSMAAPVLDQVVLARFVADGHHARHVRRMRALYLRRGEHLRAQLVARASCWLGVPRHVAGMQIAVALKPPLQAGAVSAALAADGVEAFPIGVFHWHSTPVEGLVLGFAGFDEAAMAPALDTLVAVLRRCERTAA